jgi:tRNA threonylcarbamoyl adenosine modification protein YeaZ
MDQVLRAAGLDLAQVDELVVGVGPGPFTGLRVGVVAAQTWAAVSGRPVRSVCSLDVLALAQARRGAGPNRFVAALDARRRELYWAVYDAAGARLGDPRVSAPTDLPDLPLIGPGALLHPGAGAGLEAGWARRLAVGATAEPARLDLAEVGHLVRVDAGLMAACRLDLPEVGPEPLYLRRPDATVPGPRKSALSSPRAESGRPAAAPAFRSTGRPTPPGPRTEPGPGPSIGARPVP